MYIMSLIIKLYLNGEFKILKICVILRRAKFIVKCLSEYYAVRSPKIDNSWDVINPIPSISTLIVTAHL